MDAGSSRPLTYSRPVTFTRPFTSDVDVNDIEDVENDFTQKLIKDGAETYYCARRFAAKECLFAGYRCDDVRNFYVSPHCTYERQEKNFAINWIAVHGSKAICVVIRHKDVDKASIGPFYRGYSKDAVMYHLTSAIMSEVADLAECCCQSNGMPYSVVSVNDFRGKKTHEASLAVQNTTKFLSEKMKLGCSDFTWDKTIEVAISAFQRLCLQELTAEDLYVCVCEDIELAPYNLMPYLIQDFLKRGSS